MTQLDECHLPCDGMPCSAGCHLARFCLGGARGLPGGAQGIQRTVRLRKGQCLYLVLCRFRLEDSMLLAALTGAEPLHALQNMHAAIVMAAQRG
ncbi:hypothetical protein CNE_2c15410 [Cupriavidus necator N-1]|uniref:Uncharacterized protein n=1 Tax=Cupriavidus necator (strain ATCC 43291 / DSM 13513 / CCUG 52238 / LMG 8453 / N-1) TaxID=1042878 RepID=F8GPD2_CUPNN|nr:flagellar transcriptional regulator FlhD [Cupriavidus necator]AEI80500.1 hypothetical protein CNE_2c15410 [Cupriavidus necator N-1]MDX6009873.1 flagellar transcriptional regulator FlhD [Cupriavidus necator]